MTMIYDHAVTDALSALQAAESVYNECTGDAADEAWLMLQAARLRLDRLIREAREGPFTQERVSA